MSDEIKKTVLNTLTEPIANSAKNLTDKPTQNMGTTFADIWYLVFGGISQAAEKRKLKYSYALQQFENELKEKISKIPEDKLIEPDIQVVAPALEASKFCVEKDNLRKMFSNLISSSMNNETSDYVKPIFSTIIGQLSQFEARLLKVFYENNVIDNNIPLTILSDSEENKIISALNVLESLGLIYTNIKTSLSTYRKMNKHMLTKDITEIETASIEIKENGNTMHIFLTDLGIDFCRTCLNSNSQ